MISEFILQQCALAVMGDNNAINILKKHIETNFHIPGNLTLINHFAIKPFFFTNISLPANPSFGIASYNGCLFIGKATIFLRTINTSVEFSVRPKNSLFSEVVLKVTSGTGTFSDAITPIQKNVIFSRISSDISGQTEDYCCDGYLIELFPNNFDDIAYKIS